MSTETTCSTAGKSSQSTPNFTINGMAQHARDGSILLIEPFCGGSHKQLIDLLYGKIQGCVKVTLPAKKWHWRARTSALYLAQHVPHSSKYRVMFCSSVLNLAELVALRPDLASLHKVLYFHENQLVYPVRKQQDRDFQYGYNQVLSSLVADVVVFNSKYNQNSFLDSIGSFMKLIPDHRPKNLAEQIRPKCRVLNFPICFPNKGHYEDIEEVLEPEESLVLSPESPLQQPKINMETIRESGGLVRANGLSAGSPPHDKNNLSEVKEYGDKPETVVRRRPTCLADSKESGSQTKCERRSMCFSPVEPLGAQLMSPIDPDTDAMMGRGKMDFCSGGGNNMRRSETEPACLMGGHLPCVLDLSPTSTCKSLIDMPAGVEAAQVKVDLSAMKPEVMTFEKVKKEEVEEGIPPLHIVWPHRWEHDKDPTTFFKCLYQLKEDECQFTVSVLGETFTDVPDVFSEARERLSDHVGQWGFQPSKADYYRTLEAADVVISTAKHEFFGVAMLEAVHLGCYPLCPNDLVYPEIFPKECLYNTSNQLTKMLRQFCQHPLLVRNRPSQMNVERYSWESLEAQFHNLLNMY